MNTLDRLMSGMTHVSGPLDTPCWIPALTPTGQGYTRVRVQGSKQLTHRFMYEAIVGPVAEGLEVDHLCQVRSCCNPEHLEPVTHRVNWGRSNQRAAIATRTNLCHLGHSLLDAYQYNNGPRNCRTCHRLRELRYLAKSKEV